MKIDRHKLNIHRQIFSCVFFTFTSFGSDLHKIQDDFFFFLNCDIQYLQSGVNSSLEIFLQEDQLPFY